MSPNASRTASTARPLAAGELRVDPRSREVWLHDEPLSLTSVEFTLLETLLREAGTVVTREQLTETVLGRKLGPFDRVIDVHISNIRKKLGALDRGGQWIKAVRGTGYLFAARTDTK